MMTSTIEYDLDTSGGLMEKVQALIAPPVSEEGKVKKKEGLDLHPYYKRPGKGHNHDSCDSCKEGGDLLCCDKCPASFHLLCNDPPLDENDIPMGQWICYSCRIKEMRAKQRENELKSKCDEECSVVLSKVSKTVKLEDAVNKSDLNERERRAKERAVKKLTSKASVASPRLTPSKIKLAFDKLISVGQGMNPVTFELPPELQVKIIVPGDDKVQAPGKVGSSRRSSASRKKPYERDAQGLVPLPAKVCFYCKKSCAKAALVCCDFCNMLVHLDCLDPPLTYFPVGCWMCPSHPAHYVEARLWRGASFSERVALWNKYCSCPVNEQKIKTDFLRKVYKRPYIRFRVNTNHTKTMQVPDFVKEAYKNPLPKQASLKDLVQASVWYERQQELKRGPEKKYLATPEEQELALNMGIKFHLEALAKVKMIQKSRKISEETVTKPEAMEELPVKKEDIENISNNELINGCLDPHDEASRIYSKVNNIESVNEPRCPLKLLDDLAAIVGQELESMTNGELDNGSEVEEWSNHDTTEEDSPSKQLIIHYKKSESSPADETQCIKDKNAVKLNNSEALNNEKSSQNNVQDDLHDVNEHQMNEEETGLKDTVVQNNTSDKEEPMESDDIEEPEPQPLVESDLEEIINSMDPEVVKYLALQQLKQQLTETGVAGVKPKMTNGTDDICHVFVNVDEDLEKRNISGDLKDEDSLDESGLKSNDSQEKSIVELDDSLEKSNEITTEENYDEAIANSLEQSDSKAEQFENAQPPQDIELPHKSSYKYFAYKTHLRHEIRGLLVPVPSTAFGSVYAVGARRVLVGTECIEAGQLVLTHYGYCQNTSEVHATITYCADIKKFSLINFSPSGTIVDNVAYGLTANHERTPDRLSRLGKSIEAIKRIRGKRQKVMDPAVPMNAAELREMSQAEEPGPSTSQAGQSGAGLCRCSSHPAAIPSYEGPAVLHHGSVIKFGCLEFTFSYPAVMVPFPDLPSDQNPSPAKKQCRSKNS